MTDKQKEMNDVLKEESNEVSKIESDEIPQEKEDDPDFKETIKKAAELVGEAANVVGDFAGAQLKNAKNIFEKVSKDFEENRSKQILKKYSPVRLEEIQTIEYPGLIHIVDFDKRRDIEECKEAIAFQQDINHVGVLDVYKDYSEQLGLQFYPEESVGAYIVHPADSKMYIEVNEYFKYLEEARVAELKSIAQALGATYFKVTIIEEQTEMDEKKRKGGFGVGVGKEKAEVEASKTNSASEYKEIRIAAESTYPGKEPVRPELKLWANSAAIRNLVEQRLSPDNPLLSEAFRLDYNSSTSFTSQEAANIDGALKSIKFKAKASISEQVRRANKRKFEYRIEF